MYQAINFCINDSIFLTTKVVSHEEDRKIMLSYHRGTSRPTGDFRSTDFDEKKAAYAEAGIIQDFSFSYKLKPKFGLIALLRGQANSIDVDNRNPGINFRVESGYWGMGGFLLRATGSFPISAKASFDTRAMLGFLNASSPELTITGSGPNGTFWIKNNAANATAFSYLFGAGFKFELGKKFYLLTNLDYLGSNPEFSNVETLSSDGTRTKDTYSQSIGAINVNLGLAFKL